MAHVKKVGPVVAGVCEYCGCDIILDRKRNDRKFHKDCLVSAMYIDAEKNGRICRCDSIIGKRIFHLFKETPYNFFLRVEGVR